MKPPQALTATLALALVIGASGFAAAPRQQPLLPVNPKAALQSFLSAYWDSKFQAFYAYDHAHGFGAHGPKAGTYADFWFAAQEWQTILDALDAGLVEYRPLVGQVFDGFLAHYDAETNNYNDDLGWWVQGALRAYRLTGESRYLEFAVAQFARVWRDFDPDLGGGVWWTRDGRRDQKNVATNGPLAASAVALAKATNDPTYLDKAKTLYAWMKASLTDGARVYDHRGGDAALVKWDFTYNFGAYLDAALALHDATGDAAYLADAHAAADWTLANLTSSGALLDEGDGDGAGFKAVFIRALQKLAAQDPAYQTALQDNAVQAWNHRRPDGLVGTDWSSIAPDGPLQGLAAAGAVTAILAAPRQEPARIVTGNGVYEAENARREGVGSGDRVAHSGRGYVNAFSREGQAVEFHVNAPSSGRYAITWRYSAAAGLAARSLSVNSSTLKLSFPATTTWDGWSELKTGVALNAGSNTIRLAFLPSDANYLNLDWLAITLPDAAKPLTITGLTGRTH